MGTRGLTVLATVLVAVVGSSSCAKHWQLPEQVMLDSGRVSGIAGQNPSIMVFKGIPYAAPPVGDLRWRPPQPVAPWEGVRECDAFGPSAIQQPQAPFWMWSQEFIVDTSLGYDEDCLSLNVWTATDDPDGRRPVLVFIHGGAYTSGGSSCEVYDGEALAKRGLVVVTLNYRVGILGFFAHPLLSAESEHGVSGNYGILDMVAALGWVQRNIAAFGGDPTNVTIAGQSAGASAVTVLQLSPLAKGLFHRAAALSFPALSMEPRSLEEREEAGAAAAIVENNGTPMDPSDDRVIEQFGSKTLAEMRAMSAQQLLEVSFQPWPVVDGYVIPDTTLALLTAGTYNDVPLMTGMVEGDAALFGGGPVTLAQYRSNAEAQYGELADELLEIYPAANDEEAASQARASGVDRLNVLGWALAKARMTKGNSPTYVYCFTHVTPGPGSEQFGAFHSSDLAYWFGNFSPSRAEHWTPVDYDIGEVMTSYLSSFAGTGVPSCPGQPPWQAARDDTFEVMELGAAPGGPIRLSQEKTDFWNAYVTQLLELE